MLNGIKCVKFICSGLFEMDCMAGTNTSLLLTLHPGGMDRAPTPSGRSKVSVCFGQVATRVSGWLDA